MPINVTPLPGPSDHIDDVRSHSGPGAHERMVTSESLRGDSRSGHVRILVATNVLHTNVLHTNEKNESWGSDG